MELNGRRVKMLKRSNVLSLMVTFLILLGMFLAPPILQKQLLELVGS
ncbi:hypothetical protein [Clostridium sp. YIM B02506]|nr:hypothetical protein [Clostridium sp. YIM B02506]